MMWICRHGVLIIALGLGACATAQVFPEKTSNLRAAAEPFVPSSAGVVVQQGDTLYGIASRHGVGVRDLAGWNGLVAPYTIHPGQCLGRRSPGTGVVSCGAGKDRAQGARLAPSAVLAPEGIPTPPRSVPASTAIRPSAAGHPWQWPAEGTLIQRARRDKKSEAPALEIAGSAGAPVRAVADGVVLYSGLGYPGREELIVIRHDSLWVSSYARNRTRLVGEGQRVKAGEPIAQLGRGGTVRDVLHFELFRDGVAVDPLLHLKR